MASASNIPAQSGSNRLAVAVGALAFQGRHGESGVGLSAAGRFALASNSAREVAVELGLQTLSPIDQTCSLGIGGGCNPIPPASPVAHARVLAESRIGGFSLIYVGGGIGMYGPVGPVDQAYSVALGLDASLRIRLSSRVGLEAAYVNLRASRYIGWALPLSLVVHF